MTSAAQQKPPTARKRQDLRGRPGNFLKKLCSRRNAPKLGADLKYARIGEEHMICMPLGRGARLTTLVVVSLWPARSADADTTYAAHLDASQVVFNPSYTTATGDASFSLNDAGTHLHYAIQLHGLDLEPIAANRTDPNDVIGMHIHLTVPDVTGPHILNIFGLPSEDDADLVVDYQHESLSGVFDMSDASRDPDTGDLLPQFFPLTTKLISDWLDELAAGELYLAVHTVEASATPPGVALRGQIIPVPAPGSGGCLVVFLAVFLRNRALFPCG